jgi:hypothetical protein
MKWLLPAAFCFGLLLKSLVADEPARNAQEGRFPVPEMTAKRTDVKPFEYVDVGKKIPNYTPSRVWGVQGEPLCKMQVPLSAEESSNHLVMPRGFHAELFVSEEQLGGGKPICMNWDERGRLWVAMTYDYPNNLQPPDQGHDRIVICEDTDGDGKADKVTVFAEKLSIPTSIFFARGGVIVFDAGRTIFLKDTNGDGKADVREVLFGTWNMRDTHGTASNMQYGLDNWIWGMQGYNRSRITLKNGEQTEFFNQGFFRFKADGSSFEFIRSTDNNTWGLGISEEGIIFGSTANRNPSVYMPIPNRYYERVRGWIEIAAALHHRRLVSVQADHRQGAAGGPARRLHRGCRPFAVYGAPLPQGILEPHRLRRRTDWSSRRRLCDPSRRQRLPLQQPVQPGG